jgi:hypothetical protein
MVLTTTAVSLNSINRLDFVPETSYISCEVRTGFLYTICNKGRQTHPLERILHKDYNSKGSVAKKKKKPAHEPQGVLRQDELNGSKLSVAK